PLCRTGERERDLEAARSVRLSLGDCISPMQSRDLANERQAEPSAFWITGEAIKRRKHLRALRGRDAGPAIGHLEHDHGARTTHTNPHRRLAMALGILEEVADHPAQQPGIAADRDRLAFEFAII